MPLHLTLCSSQLPNGISFPTLLKLLSQHAKLLSLVIHSSFFHFLWQGPRPKEMNRRLSLSLAALTTAQQPHLHSMWLLSGLCCTTEILILAGKRSHVPNLAIRQTGCKNFKTSQSKAKNLTLLEYWLNYHMDINISGPFFCMTSLSLLRTV